MKYVDATSAKHAIDRLYSNGEPFVFFTDYLCERIFVAKIAELDREQIQFVSPHLSFTRSINPTENQPFEWSITPPPFETYERAFRNVVRRIKQGDSYLVNLTFASHLRTDLSLEEMFFRFHAPYKLFVNEQFTLFSPEPFVRISADGRIATFPMKGTISASIANTEETLLNDPKEAAEHATIVDLMRNDLNQIASDVCVERYRYVERINTQTGGIFQTSSAVSGKLLPHYRNHIGTALFSMLPAGSITGAPKHKTLEIIAQSEISERGFYTGVFGVFDGHTLDSAVMIRFVENQNGQFFFRSGGGITASSVCESEYNEIILKAHAPLC